MKLTTKQQIRVDVIYQYLNGLIFSEDACVVIGVQERQFRRLVKKFREDGLTSILHGNKGRVPPNRISLGLANRLLSIYKNKYNGFNLVHFIEKLKENEKDKFAKVPCYSTIRNLFINEDLVRVKRRRGAKVHRMRKSYEKEGIMVQIDGSPHRWLSQHHPFCLTAAIDDATGRLLGGKFTKTETTFAAMDVVESIIKKHGCFQMLYSDKAGIYGGGKRDGYCNMNRAMSELGIISLQANSPQAKGKVERLFATLQDRLISEMRLKNIKTMKEANKYFENEFIDYFNTRFARVAKNPDTAYRPLAEDLVLNEVFTMRDVRVINSGHVLNYNSNQYVITSDENLMKKNVEIRKYRNGDMRMFLFCGQELEFNLLEKFKFAA